MKYLALVIVLMLAGCSYTMRIESRPSVPAVAAYPTESEAVPPQCSLHAPCCKDAGKIVLPLAGGKECQCFCHRKAAWAAQGHDWLVCEHCHRGAFIERDERTPSDTDEPIPGPEAD